MRIHFGEQQFASCLAGEHQEGGLEGVFSVLLMAQHAPMASQSHPNVDKIAFTGHYETTKIIQKSAADTLKRVTFELDGLSQQKTKADLTVNALASQLSVRVAQTCCTAGPAT